MADHPQSAQPVLACSDGGGAGSRRRPIRPEPFSGFGQACEYPMSSGLAVDIRVPRTGQTESNAWGSQILPLAEAGGEVGGGRRRENEKETAHRDQRPEQGHSRKFSPRRGTGAVLGREDSFKQGAGGGRLPPGNLLGPHLDQPGTAAAQAARPRRPGGPPRQGPANAPGPPAEAHSSRSLWAERAPGRRLQAGVWRSGGGRAANAAEGGGAGVRLRKRSAGLWLVFNPGGPAGRITGREGGPWLRGAARPLGERTGATAGKRARGQRGCELAQPGADWRKPRLTGAIAFARTQPAVLLNHAFWPIQMVQKACCTRAPR